MASLILSHPRGVTTVQQMFVQRLTTDGFLDVLPAVLITGKGMPDLATRFALVLLHSSMEGDVNLKFDRGFF